MTIISSSKRQNVTTHNFFKHLNNFFSKTFLTVLSLKIAFNVRQILKSLEHETTNKSQNRVLCGREKQANFLLQKFVDCHVIY